jgi:hypothetical protein
MQGLQDRALRDALDADRRFADAARRALEQVHGGQAGEDIRGGRGAERYEWGVGQEWESERCGWREQLTVLQAGLGAVSR